MLIYYFVKLLKSCLIFSYISFPNKPPKPPTTPTIKANTTFRIGCIKSIDPNVEYINIIVVKRSPEKKATAEFILLLISIFY